MNAFIKKLFWIFGLFTLKNEIFNLTLNYIDEYLNSESHVLDRVLDTTETH